MKIPDAHEMSSKGGSRNQWEWCPAVLVPLAGPNGYLVPAKVQILHAELQAFE
jgi:hypothetical protein